jgi:DNA invertase Pin-like site-specific DNA recombinase
MKQTSNVAKPWSYPMAAKGKNDATDAEFRKAKAVAAYLRVSTTNQNEASQRAEIERWLAGNGTDPAGVRWFVDKGECRDHLDRPAFKRLQAAAFAGEIGTVVVYKLDRIGGGLRGGINALCEWIERGLRVVSVMQQIDFNGKLGTMLAAVLLGISELDQENRRENQAKGIAAAKKANGGRCPWGGRQRGTTKADPARALELRDKGLKPEEIANALGVTKMSVYRYFKQAKGTE